MNNETALLVMDYQNAIIGQLPEQKSLLERAAKAIQIARRHGATIGYVRVAFNDDDIKAMPERNKMTAALSRYGDAIRNGTQATAIHHDISPQPGDIVVRKTRVGPFSTTDLEKQLRDRGITTLVLAGITTSGVVLSTVRDAADRDFKLVVLSDACADPVQDVHDCLIEKVFPRQADVITVDEFEDALLA